MLVRGYMIGVEVHSSRTRAVYRGIGLGHEKPPVGVRVSAWAQPATTTSERPLRQPGSPHVMVPQALDGLVRQILNGGRPVSGLERGLA